METLFVYGTLRDPQIQIEVIGRRISGTADTLDGYERSTIQLGRHRYPCIRLRKRASTSGLRLPVTMQELELTDAYETSAYKRIRISLRSGHSAWVYVRNQV